MTISRREVVYPDGDRQEIDHPLRVDDVVDLNGIPLELPLPTSKMIAYRVYKIRTTEERGEVLTCYYLELLTRDTIGEYTTD